MSAPTFTGRRIGIGAALSRVALALAVAFGALGVGAGYWQVWMSAELSRSPDDAAVIAAARNVLRGEILDRDGTKLAFNKRDSHGEPYRAYASRSLSGVIGYSSRQFGDAGLEGAWKAELSGLISADEVREMIRKFQADPSDPQRLRTSLSLELQDRAVELLGGSKGAIVMLDPRTGEVLVLASTPTFDASAVANPATSQATMTALRTDDRQPLFPRATLGQYTPGSVFKIVTAFAALGSGAVSGSTTFEEQPAAERTGLLVEGFRVRDGHHTATGSTALDFRDAVEVSCNIWFALAGLRTGGQGLVDWASRLGFGAEIPFELPVAKSQVTGGDGGLDGGFSDRVELANAAYGQGETLVSPMQMALVAAAVANDGVIMEPRLVLSATGKGGTTTFAPSIWHRVTDRAIAREIGAAMRQAVAGQLGRQFTAGASVRGLAVAGKSGTAQLDPGRRNHSWFIGFAPFDDPRVAIAVVVEGREADAPKAPAIAGGMFRAWVAWSR